MNNDYHFLPAEKLLRTTKKKMDGDVIKSTQSYTEKVLTDIINRSALLARHSDANIIDVPEVSIIIEKDFDYSFGIRTILGDQSLPSNEHIERQAELRRQNK